MMREQTSIRLPDTSTTFPAACLLSAASNRRSIFTGKERDTESGNDYFGARYYASSMGRFMSPDWSAKVMPVPYAKLDDPQSLNLYAYVGNNPLIRFDKDGHACDSISSCFKSLLNSVQVTISGGFTWGVSGQAGPAKGKLEASPLAGEAKSGLAGGDAEGKIKSEVSASGNVGPLQAKVGAGGQISTSSGPSLSAEASASAGPGEAKASASLDPSGAHTELSADASKSANTDTTIALGGKAFLGITVSVDLTQAGEAVQGLFNLGLQSQYSSLEPVVGPSVEASGLTFQDQSNPVWYGGPNN